MPSPFPGIDPYLEPRFWRDFHGRCIAYAAEVLPPQLPQRYRALIDERLVVAANERIVYSDLTVVETRVVRETSVVAYGTETDVIEFDEPVLFPTALEDVFESFIEIRDREGDRLVTTIELLSPTNKTAGPGRDRYLQKQEEVLRAGANLVEIDLLRGGQRTVATTVQFVHDRFYSVVVVWRSARTRHEAYFVHLENRLPRIRIPLLPEDNDVGLDVQGLFTRCYEAARYDRAIDYRQNPDVPLTARDLEWLDERLRSRGLRS